MKKNRKVGKGMCVKGLGYVRNWKKGKVKLEGGGSRW